MILEVNTHTHTTRESTLAAQAPSKDNVKDKTEQVILAFPTFALDCLPEKV